MSDTKHTQEKWRAETARDERKARLAAMKSKDGGKKPLRTSNRLAKVITVLVLVVLLAAGGVWWVFNIGVPQRTVSALTISGEKITAAEFNYFYYSQLANYSIDPTTDDGKSILASTYDETFPTVADFVKDQAAQQLQQLVILTQAAAEAGVTLDDADRSTVDYYLSNIESQATSAGQTVENYLIANYGKGMNVQVMTRILERHVLADKYSTQMQDSYSFSDDDIAAYYDENKDDFDLVTYRDFYIAVVAATDATDEEKAAAKTAAEDKADAMLAKVTDEATFKAQCIANAADDDEKATYTDSDASLNADQLKSAIYNTDIGAWLYDAARKAGDKTVIESTNGYYVLYFVDRAKDTIEHVSVRHILVSADRESSTEEQLAVAREKAEAILDKYKSGDKTEDAFTALVADNTADTGSAATGGLYTDISPSSSYVEEFLAWATDENRRDGDTGIVQTKFGFHIMYFVGVDDIEWRINVRNTLISEKYNSWLEEQKTAKPYVLDSFGMRFTG